MSISVPLRIDKLFEFTVAAMLQESGYVAGVPLRLLGGRGTSHQIDAMGIEFKQVPFTYDTILLAEAKCYDQTRAVGVGVIRELKSILIDLEQTLPRDLQLIPRGMTPGWYIHNLIGNRTGEKLTANYRGAVFSTKRFSPRAKQFAYAHGIYLFRFPDIVRGKTIVAWMEELLKRLEELHKHEKEFVHLVGEKRYQIYREALDKLFSTEERLDQRDRHQLFGIVANVLRLDERFAGFWGYVKLLKVLDISGYPVLAWMEVSPPMVIRNVLEHYQAVSRRKYRKLGTRLGFSGLRLFVKPREEEEEDFVTLPFAIYDKERKILSGHMCIPVFMIKMVKQGMISLSLPLREGLYLVSKMR